MLEIHQWMIFVCFPMSNDDILQKCFNTAQNENANEDGIPEVLSHKYTIKEAKAAVKLLQ